MTKISACIIAKNEELVIEKALSSICDVVDEIIFVDTGSTDKTVQIAKNYTDKIYHFKWIDDFSAARNEALKYASNEYILSWDADWVMPLQSQQEFKKIKNKNFENADLVYFDWNLEGVYDGDVFLPTRNMKYNFVFKKSLFTWQSPIHNYLQLLNSNEKIKTKTYSQIQVNHIRKEAKKEWRHHQTLDILQKEVAKNNQNSHRLRYYLARELFVDQQYEKSLLTYQEYLATISSKTDEFSFILEHIGFCYLRLKKIAEGKKFLQKYYKTEEKKPRFILSFADFVVLQDLEMGIHLYEKYLKKPLTPESTDFDFDSERFTVHPYLMLAKISLKQNNPGLAKSYLKKALANTKVTETKNECLNLIKLFS